MSQGVFHGVTGVIAQPIKGAKHGGLWGLVKGTGKGVIGLVIRPTAGLFDLTSATLNTIQKKTQVGDTEVSQVRPARFIGPEKIVYPYSPTKAVGYAVFLKLNSGKLVETDYFFDYVELIEEPLKAILITNNRFSFVKHVKSSLSERFEDEFIFGFHEFVRPLATSGNAINITLAESAGFPGLGFIGKQKKKEVVRKLTVKTEDLAEKVKNLVNQAYEEYKSTNST